MGAMLERAHYASARCFHELARSRRKSAVAVDACGAVLAARCSTSHLASPRACEALTHRVADILFRANKDTPTPCGCNCKYSQVSAARADLHRYSTTFSSVFGYSADVDKII